MKQAHAQQPPSTRCCVHLHACCVAVRCLTVNSSKVHLLTAKVECEERRGLAQQLLEASTSLLEGIGNHTANSDNQERKSKASSESESLQRRSC